MKENEVFTQCKVRLDRSKVVNPLALKSQDEQGWPVGTIVSVIMDDVGNELVGVQWPPDSYLSKWWYPEQLEQVT